MDHFPTNRYHSHWYQLQPITDICWYSCEAEFIQNLPSTSKLPSSQFKFTSRYIHNAFHLQTNTAPSVWRLITRCHFLPMNPNRGANWERTLSSWIHAPIFRRSWNLTWTLHYRQKMWRFQVPQRLANIHYLSETFPSFPVYDISPRLIRYGKRAKESISSLHITSEGVEKRLRGINPSKAQGPDKIPNLVLKTCSQQLAPGLATIFQRSVDAGTLPSDWRNANVAPVFKREMFTKLKIIAPSLWLAWHVNF